MTKYLILYAAVALVFFPLDFIWLSTMGKNFYMPELGDLMQDRPNLVIAGLFYLAYVAGVVVLVAAPADGDIVKALLYGAVLGFVAYGTYDLTNLSTISGFSPKVAAVDMAWGTTLTAVSSAAGVWISRFFA
ncbi:membrane protein [Devosia soli]|uniref:Membrane protein n=1 Tax=Devosia soli TaxID=361041 RepID=A0A0F5LD03_9HYPH|nr:DUF2177 family protein [Devosia soli]KKB80135.1 membrane protein [Devosia soli]